MIALAASPRKPFKGVETRPGSVFGSGTLE